MTNPTGDPADPAHALRMWAYANLVPQHTYEELANTSNDDLALLVEASGADVSAIGQPEKPGRDTTPDPWGPPATSADADRVQRWHPHPQAVEHARALLAAAPEADFAVIPLFQPGKVEGWWTCGQPVHTVFGVALLSQNTFEPTGLIPGHSWVRDTACVIAAERLRAYAADHPDTRAADGGIGTVAWATVDRDSTHVPVHEDVLPVSAEDNPRTPEEDPVAYVLTELHNVVCTDGEVDVLNALSKRAGLVWTCRAETCSGQPNTSNQDTCGDCGTPRHHG